MSYISIGKNDSRYETLKKGFNQRWPSDGADASAICGCRSVDDAQQALQASAAVLKRHPNIRIAIEGHCDEKGTEEYNRALGDRRALALREALAKLDVSPSRLDTISYGKDRPVDTGKTEAANRLNRRGEFVVLTPR